MADLEQQFLATDPEVLGLQRQRQLANLLTGQAFNQPQGQMISGHYVAPSALQQALPMINAAIGGLSNANLDAKQQALAEALRGKQMEVAQQYFQAKTPQERMTAAMSPYAPKAIQTAYAERLKGQKLAQGERITYEDGTTIEGAPKLHSVDGNLVDSQGRIIFKAPKVFAPHANQLVPIQGGFAEYNPNTRTLTPIGGSQGNATGAPTGALMPPLPQHLQTEMAAINQQKSVINDALKSVEQNPDAFGPKFAAPGIIGGEFGTARMNEKLPSQQVEARSKVFNIASAVIKERAGTAQSKQEQETIMRFLPSPFDGSKAIIDKFNAFNDYLASKEKGINPNVGAVPTYRPNANKNAIPAGVTPEQWNVMTPEEKAAFK